jgi:hypothetical protein
MNPKLIEAIRDRIKAGRSQAAIQTEVMGFGYSEEAFLAAYNEALKSAEPETVIEDAGPQAQDNSLVIGTETVLTLPGYKELFLRALKLAQSCLPQLGKGILFSLLAVVLFGGGTLALFASGAYLGAAGFLTTIALALIWVILFLLVLSASVTSILRSVLKRNQNEDYWQHVRWSFVNVVAILLVGLYVNIFLQIGYSLLIIPGIIVSIYTFFAVMMTVSGDGRGVAALAASTSLIHGRFFPILGRVLASVGVMILLIVLAALVSSLTFFVEPLLLPVVFIPLTLLVLFWHTCFSVVLYESLKVLPKKAELPIKEATLINIMRVVIGIIVVGLVLIGSLFGYGISAIYNNYMYEEGGSIKDLSVDMTKKTYLKILSEQMEIHKEANGSYEGACEEAEVGSVCVSDAATYLLEIPLSKGFYCIDNTGYNEVTRRSSIIFGVCDRERVGEDEAVPLPETETTETTEEN